MRVSTGRLHYGETLKENNTLRISRRQGVCSTARLASIRVSKVEVRLEGTLVSKFQQSDIYKVKCM